ncbi:hypothetical protein Ancab_015505 [Ancistrocladus abbreviatus]
MKSNPTFDMAPDKPTSSHIMKNGGLEPVNSTPSPDKPRPMVLDLNCLNLAKGISHEASDGNKRFRTVLTDLVCIHHISLVVLLETRINGAKAARVISQLQSSGFDGSAISKAVGFRGGI